MSLEEKNERQRLIIRKLYESLSKEPDDKEFYLKSYFLAKLRELFKNEMDFYGLKCFQKNEDDNDIIYKVEYLPKEEWAAKFNHSVGVTPSGEIVFITPEVIVNTAGYTFQNLCDSDHQKRISCCKFILLDLMHEIRHSRQTAMIREGKSSHFNLLGAKEELVASQDYAFYHDNHDSFSYEAEADYAAHGFMINLGFMDPHSLFSVSIYNAAIATGNLIIPNTGLVDRDEYINSKAHDILLNHAFKDHYLKIFPILTKEYNPDNTKKRLTELITNHNREISEAEKKIDNPNVREVFVRDINSMYYEMYRTILLENNRFEIYEAILNHGIDKFVELLNNLDNYVSQTKTENIGLIQSRTIGLRVMDNDINTFCIGKNNGFIINPNGKRNELIEAKAYIDVLNFDTNNEAVLKYIHNSHFLSSIPVYGYYILTSGTKISIFDFINEYMIPSLAKVSPEDYDQEVLNVVRRYTKPIYEMEEQYNIEKVNKQYQKIHNQIKKIKEAFTCSLGDKQNRYDKYLFKNMELVVKLVDYEDKEAFKVFNAPVVRKGGYIYKNFKPSQVKLFEDLKIAAQVLTMDEFFNPEKINYYNKFISNYLILMLEGDIEAYKRNTYSEPSFNENNATL